jgi:hypothetical protein
MSERRKLVLVTLGISVLFMVGGLAESIAGQKSTAPTPSEHRGAVVAGEAAAKQLLLLMDTDKNGKVSKQEWMSFMEAEFDRLDTNKDGVLDVKELEKTQLRPVPFYKAGK